LNHVYIPRTTQTCTTHCCHLSNYTTYKKTSKHTAMKKRDVPKSLLYHIHYVPKTSCPEMEMDIFMSRSIPNKNLCTDVVCPEIVEVISRRTFSAIICYLPSGPTRGRFELWSPSRRIYAMVWKRKQP